MIVRREEQPDIDVIRTVTQAAFAPDKTGSGSPDLAAEATLVDDLRADVGWLPALSLVAVLDGMVVGHVATTRGYVGDVAVLGLGPLSVLPEHQRRGIGSALVHTTLGAADALHEPLVALLGSPDYYGRFGFVPATEHGIQAPDPTWARFFQVRLLSAYRPTIRGEFRYAEPFSRL